ncbi:4-oxalocrotonate tautomerase family protein [Streptomyces sp. NPDC059171]|uniref:tautomerase family protein n=1 Tax=Streptomyces sp. NPDC059171 TaxID=3346755 RepID=UPI0036BCF152
MSADAAVADAEVADAAVPRPAPPRPEQKELPVPVIAVDWWKGNDRAQRQELVEELTACVSRIAGCPEEAVTVIVRDVETDHWGKGGVLADALLAGAASRPGQQDTGGQQP